jgi:hypothetical protein
MRNAIIKNGVGVLARRRHRAFELVLKSDRVEYDQISQVSRQVEFWVVTLGKVAQLRPMLDCSTPPVPPPNRMGGHSSRLGVGNRKIQFSQIMHCS